MTFGNQPLSWGQLWLQAQVINSVWTSQKLQNIHMWRATSSMTVVTQSWP